MGKWHEGGKNSKILCNLYCSVNILKAKFTFV